VNRFGVVLRDAIQVGKEKLRPEYAVTERYERTDDGITVFFVIVEEEERGWGT